MIRIIAETEAATIKVSSTQISFIQLWSISVCRYKLRVKVLYVPGFILSGSCVARRIALT